MFNKFENLNDNSKKEFILKYYPLILRTQQEKDSLSKLAFLRRYFQVSRGEYKGKLLISKSSYKRYLKIVKDLYLITFESEKSGDILRSDIEPFYSNLEIPKLHSVKFGYVLVDEILSKIDKDVFEEIFEKVNYNTSFERQIKKSEEEHSEKLKSTATLLQESGLLDIVFSTFCNIMENRYQNKGGKANSDTLRVESFYLNTVLDSKSLKVNGEIFLEQFSKELEKLYQTTKESEEQFDRELELYYTPPYERFDYYDDEASN